ncbi:MAG: hypothetical protein AAB432_01155 [Patescibacteria group bacterium]
MIKRKISAQADIDGVADDDLNPIEEEDDEEGLEGDPANEPDYSSTNPSEESEGF